MAVHPDTLRVLPPTTGRKPSKLDSSEALNSFFAAIDNPKRAFDRTKYAPARRSPQTTPDTKRNGWAKVASKKTGEVAADCPDQPPKQPEQPPPLFEQNEVDPDPEAKWIPTTEFGAIVEYCRALQRGTRAEFMLEGDKFAQFNSKNKTYDAWVIEAKIRADGIEEIIFAVKTDADITEFLPKKSHSIKIVMVQHDAEKEVAAELEAQKQAELQATKAQGPTYLPPHKDPNWLANREARKEAERKAKEQADLPPHKNPARVAAYEAKKDAERKAKEDAEKTAEEISIRFRTYRIDVPEERKDWAQYAFFKAEEKVITPDAEEQYKAQPVYQPLITEQDGSPTMANLQLTKLNGSKIKFILEQSENTYLAENSGLEKIRTQELDMMPNEVIKFIMDFKKPGFFTNLHDKYPHLSRENQHRLQPVIQDWLTSLNRDQKAVFYDLFTHMACGLAIVPGCGGSGKTTLSLTTVLAIQSLARCVVVYMLDINQPLDDIARKYNRMADKLTGKKLLCIRVHNRNQELKNSEVVSYIRDHVRTRKCFSSHVRPELDMAKLNASKDRDGFYSLDAAAWIEYAKSPEKYFPVTKMLEETKGPIMDSFNLRGAIFSLYMSTLRKADFVAGTPVALNANFKLLHPDVVIIDECAHAREASALIALTSWSPTMTLMVGDHRQCIPCVKLADKHKYGRQMEISLMERAMKQGAVTHQLLMNHRAFGDLQDFCSKKYYGGGMVSGIEPSKRFPPEIEPSRKLWNDPSITRGIPCNIPRVVVVVKSGGNMDDSDMSKVNFNHGLLFAKQSLQLVLDPDFRNVDTGEPGTIAYLGPYKKAVEWCRKIVECMDRMHPELGIAARVEARSFDECQGSEADAVFIDQATDAPTDFVNGKHRGNVGSTRARLAETIYMSKKMADSTKLKELHNVNDLYLSCSATGLPMDGSRHGEIVTCDMSKQTFGLITNPPVREGKDAATEALRAKDAAAVATTMQTSVKAIMDQALTLEEGKKWARKFGGYVD